MYNRGMHVFPSEFQSHICLSLPGFYTKYESLISFFSERLGFIDATAGCYITALIFGFVVALQSTQSSRLFSKKFYIIGLGCAIFASEYPSNLDISIN